MSGAATKVRSLLSGARATTALMSELEAAAIIAPAPPPEKPMTPNWHFVPRWQVSSQTTRLTRLLPR